MAALLSLGLFFYYLDDFFVVFSEQEKAKLFVKEFDDICRDLYVGVNNKKKQLGYIVDFLGLEFDTLQIEAHLPKDKLNKAIEGVIKIFEKKSSTTHEELQFLVGLLLFAAKVIHPRRAFP